MEEKQHGRMGKRDNGFLRMIIVRARSLEGR
jgi:hypothetical protein